MKNEGISTVISRGEIIPRGRNPSTKVNVWPYNIEILTRIRSRQIAQKEIRTLNWFYKCNARFFVNIWPTIIVHSSSLYCDKQNYDWNGREYADDNHHNGYNREIVAEDENCLEKTPHLHLWSPRITNWTRMQFAHSEVVLSTVFLSR